MYFPPDLVCNECIYCFFDLSQSVENISMISISLQHVRIDYIFHTEIFFRRKNLTTKVSNVEKFSMQTIKKGLSLRANNPSQSNIFCYNSMTLPWKQKNSLSSVTERYKCINMKWNA